MWQYHFTQTIIHYISCLPQTLVPTNSYRILIFADQYQVILSYSKQPYFKDSRGTLWKCQIYLIWILLPVLSLYNKMQKCINLKKNYIFFSFESLQQHNKLHNKAYLITFKNVEMLLRQMWQAYSEISRS